MPDAPHVALLIETSRSYGRGLLQGVIRYQREFGPWSIYFRPHGLESPPPSWLRDWRGDGILARIDSRELADAVLATGVPAIDLRFTFDDLGLPGVGVDNRAIVQLAFDHLVDRGFRRFAFCGMPLGRNRWMDHRAELFQEFAQSAGYSCDLFQPRRTRRSGIAWEVEQQQLVDWLAGLVKPIGVMACNDDRGQQLLDAARRAVIHVPDEVAVIGVDNDLYLCNLSQPPLSSVDINAQGVGFEAARVLAKMMAGSTLPTEMVYVPPRGNAERQSTDVLAIDDDELKRVLKYIREHACDGIRVDDVLRQSSLSRSVLERRLKRLLGRPTKSEILRVQIERAKQLLSDTSLSSAEISAKVGFSQAKYFSEVFHKKVGMTPSVFREQAKKPL